MTYRMSPQGLECLVLEEGEALKAYKDVAGVWTIGVGHTSSAGSPKVAPGMIISKEESRNILQRDLTKFMQRVELAMANAKQHEIDGGGSFDFNTGAILKASWVKAWINRDRSGVRRGLLLYNKAGGRTISGLVARRGREADMILDGVYRTGTTPMATSEGSLRKGDVGPVVVEWQKKLVSLGYLKDADGRFGPDTEQAVKDFQKTHPQLRADGIIGPATRNAIDRTLAARTKTKTTVGTTAAAEGGTAAVDQTTQVDVFGWDLTTLLFIGFGVVGLLVLVYVLWQYRDELKTWWK